MPKTKNTRLIDTSNPQNRTPLSEDRSKITDPWTKEQCVEELQKIATANPDQVITRNFFRVHSRIAESVWNRHFGTFLEFKRAANIILSRHVHGLERHIAKHASKDKMREANQEKRSWEGAYLRPDTTRFQTVLVGSDMHDLECDPFYLRMFLETAKRVQPEKIVLNGDILDLTEFGKYTQDPRDYKPIERLRWLQSLLQGLRDRCADAEILFVEGNHEYRLLRHLTEATPAMVTVLSDLHGMRIPDLLGLTKFEVNYIARMDLSAWTERDIKEQLKKNYVVLYDCLLFHHFPEGFTMGYPGANGHHHKHLVRHAYSPTFGPYEWHQLGCGHRRQASYCAGEKWSNGFLLCHVDTHAKRVQMEYVDTSHAHCMLGGKFYSRKGEEESVADLSIR